MKHIPGFRILWILIVLSCARLSAQPVFTCQEFAKPEPKWRPIPLWFWNNTTIKESELEGKAEDVIHAIRKSSTGRMNMKSADWKQLFKAVDELYPTFNERLLKELGNFTDQQKQVCYLMRIGLSKPQIQNMTNLARVTIWRWVKKYDWVFTSED